VLDARQRLTLLAVLLTAVYFAVSPAPGVDGPPLKAAEVKGPATAGFQPFVGTLNGFEFYDVTKAPRDDPSACAAGERRELQEAEVRDEIDFAVTYLPRGATLEFVGGQRCPDGVLMVQLDYELSSREQLTIAHIRVPRRVPGIAPRSQLRAVRLRGRPAVLNSSLGGSGELYMSDGSGDSGYFYISGFNLPRSELLKIGQGIVKR
jgi:hypothetical protein